jgi:SAM-dependent methyltransferase
MTSDDPKSPPPRLYDDLVPWYALIDPVEDHRVEAEAWAAAFFGAATPRPETLLELGSGRGGNAFHLKRRFRCTLTDLSAKMLASSRELNPECDHVPGDMRTLRLGRTFDAVLVHDAVAYLTSEQDLFAAAQTAFAHTRKGGAALFAPDCTRETFREETDLHSRDEGPRSLRCLEWRFDPDPADGTYVVEYAFLLREGRETRFVHDRHACGLFERAAWLRILRSAGYRVDSKQQPLGGVVVEWFLCRRE